LGGEIGAKSENRPVFWANWRAQRRQGAPGSSASSLFLSLVPRAGGIYDVLTADGRLLDVLEPERERRCTPVVR